MGLCVAIGINEICTVNDDTRCNDGMNEFTDPAIALLYEERYGVENTTVSNMTTSHLLPPVLDLLNSAAIQCTVRKRRYLTYLQWNVSAASYPMLVACRRVAEGNLQPLDSCNRRAHDLAG